MATTTVPTDQQTLDQLRIAFFNVSASEHAQYTVNGQTFTKIDIEKLENMITSYETRVARSSRGSVFGVLRNGGPAG